MQPPSPETPSPALRQALEFGPILVFLVTYFVMREQTVTIGGTDYGGFMVAIAVLIPLQLGAMAILRWLIGKVTRMQVLILFMVVVMGGLTVALNDEQFFKMRSTIVFGSISVVLWIGLWRGKSGLAYVLEDALPISHEGWMILTRRMAWFMLAFAAANEVVWRNFSTDVYVIWDTFGQMGVMFVFLLSNFRLVEAHWQGPEEG